MIARGGLIVVAGPINYGSTVGLASAEHRLPALYTSRLAVSHRMMWLCSTGAGAPAEPTASSNGTTPADLPVQ
jgi:hypothetical protein